MEKFEQILKSELSEKLGVSGIFETYKNNLSQMLNEDGSLPESGMNYLQNALTKIESLVSGNSSENTREFAHLSVEDLQILHRDISSLVEEYKDKVSMETV
jgi:hypothetical protein